MMQIMKILKQKSVLSLMWVLTSVALIWSCTENPFSDNIFSGGDGQNFSGTVQLENSADPSGVFVWLEAFNLKTTTDKDGKFSFKLPPRQQSHPGGGLTGYYTIYFYVENYDVLSVRIFLFDGAVDYTKSGLDSDGRFKAKIELRKLLNIHCYLDTLQMRNMNYPGLIISTDLLSVHSAALTITTTLLRGGGWASVLLHKQGTPKDSVIIIDQGGFLGAVHVFDPQKLSLYIPTGSVVLNPGVYFPIPFLYLERDLPTGLIDALGHEKRTLSAAFLQLPIRLDISPFIIK